MKRHRLSICVLAAMLLAAICTGVLAIGGYFASHPYSYLAPRDHHGRYRLVAVYWSGDMGMRLGVGNGVVERLRAKGIPVLTVNSPVLFSRQRDRAFVDQAVENSLRTALARSGADQAAMIGNSFGADMLVTGIGTIPLLLRRRIASIVLIVPGAEIYFHANPSGIFYRGPAAADPDHTVPLLRGLPITCIYGTRERASLCARPVMAGTRRVALPDGHLMLTSHRQLYAAIEDAINHPPARLARLP